MASIAAGRVLVAVVVAVVAPCAFAVQDTTRVSVDSSGAQGNGESFNAVPSPDGRFVAFASFASNLVAADGNGQCDIFVRDMLTGAIERVSVDSNGNEGDGLSGAYTGQMLSSDGTFVVFESNATNLVPADTNGIYDVFVHDRSSGTTTRVSVDSAGAEGDGYSSLACISADGRFVTFESVATNLVAGDTNARMDIFVHELATGITERVSVDSAGAQAKLRSYSPTISGDGRFVCFTSNARALVPGDTNGCADIFVRDRQLGTTELVSVDSSGNQGNGNSLNAGISGDGRWVAFSSGASNLVASDLNNTVDVFVHDRTAGTTVLASVDSSGIQENRGAEFPLISGDGRMVAFFSDSDNLVPGDTNQRSDSFVHDMVTGATMRVSVDSSGAEANDTCSPEGLTFDGRVVGFGSSADNLVPSDTNGVADVFVHDSCSTPASWTNYGAGVPGTNGVPAFTAQQFPSFGSTVTVDLANSLGAPTFGLLAFGFQRAAIPTKFGGDLLVLPTILVPITFTLGADSFTGTIPDDLALCGVTFDLQGIETDPGAVKGWSFSQGLELVIGS